MTRETAGRRVESAMVGQTLSATKAAVAATTSTTATTPLLHNACKVPVVRSLAAQALATAT